METMASAADSGLAIELISFIAGLMLSGLVYYYNQVIITDDSREDLRARLAEGGMMQRYRAVVGGALDWVDRLLARGGTAEHLKAERERPFSARLFEVSLTLALVYPAVLLIGFWAVNAGAARLGANFEILDADAGWLPKTLALVALLVTLTLAIVARTMRQSKGGEWKEFTWLTIAVLVVTAGTFAVIHRDAGGSEGAPRLLSTAVITSIVAAVTLAAAGALRGATALAVALLSAAAAVFVWDVAACGQQATRWDVLSCQAPAPGEEVEVFMRQLGQKVGLGESAFVQFGVTPPLAVALFLGALLLFAIGAPKERKGVTFWPKGAVLRAFAFMIGSMVGAAAGSIALGQPPALEVVLGFGLAMFFVVAVAQLASGLTRALSDATDSPTLSFIVFSAFLGAVGYGFLYLLNLDAVDENLRMFFVMFAFMPALNVAFDFLTTGATRWALRNGLGSGRGFPFLWTLIDFAVAAMLFVGLGFAMVLAAHFAPVMNVRETLADIQAQPHEYWWLFIALLSTLAPTLLHLSLAIFSIVLFCWSGLARWVARLVESGGKSGGSRAIASILLTAFSVLAFALPIALFAVLVLYVAPQAPELGVAYVGMLERFAELLAGAQSG